MKQETIIEAAEALIEKLKQQIHELQDIKYVAESFSEERTDLLNMMMDHGRRHKSCREDLLSLIGAGRNWASLEEKTRNKYCKLLRDDWDEK